MVKAYFVFQISSAAIIVGAIIFCISLAFKGNAKTQTMISDIGTIFIIPGIAGAGISLVMFIFSAVMKALL